MPVRALLLDGFGTVLDWRAPFAQVHEDALRRAHAVVDGSIKGLPGFSEWNAHYESLRVRDRERLDPEHRERDYVGRFQESLKLSGLVKRHARDLGLKACERYFLELSGSVRLAPDATNEFWLSLPDGVKVALVSNYGDGASLRKALARLGVSHRFDALVVTGDIGHLKPHPKVFERALADLDVPASEALMVGDDHARDVVGPTALGIRSALVANPREGLRDPRAEPQPADAAPAVAKLASLREVVDLIGRLD